MSQRTARYAVTLAVAVAPMDGLLARQAKVSGAVTVLDRGNRAARDVGQAVVWMVSGRPPAPAADSISIVTEDKNFSPRLSVVTVGSVVRFPNNDPFNHNVFSLSEEGPFDLGLYGRRQARSARFDRPGVIKVYCNVHANMSAVIVVLETDLHTRPGADGSFGIDDVPPGRYTLRVWHERASAVEERDVVVPARGVHTLAFELDARSYRRVQHLNKFGRPYRRAGRRY